LLGQTIANYRLKSLLAQERGTAIYLGEDVRAERAVAIQVWQGERVEEAPGTLRTDEVRAASALGHPNIAQVFEAGVWDAAKPYRVMEPLDGETLAARLRVQANVRVPEALAIAREAARALQAAHAAGIVHGQLTPASVFITLDPTAARGERVKLLDLGGAAAVEPRADCRAVGDLLYEMLCGFSSSLVEEVEGAVPPPSSFNSDVPEALDRLILAALARADGEGLGSMAELLRGLDSLLAPDTTSAPLQTDEPADSSPHGTSAFDVPPVELPPVAPVVAVPPKRLRTLTFLRGWLPARMAAGAALVGLVVTVSILARRSHDPRPARRTPQRAAAVLPPPVPVAPPVQMAALPVAAKPPEVQLEAPPPTELPAPERACRISIGSKPWSEVWIDGKSTGRHTPLLNYKIACGQRTLTLRNAELSLAKSVVVTLKPRSRLRKVVRLTDSSEK
jgi:hypothetical protein